MMIDMYIIQLLSVAYLASTEQAKEKKRIKFEIAIVFENKQTFTRLLSIPVLPSLVIQIVSVPCSTKQSLLPLEI